MPEKIKLSDLKLTPKEMEDFLKGSQLLFGEKKRPLGKPKRPRKPKLAEV
jgi:hypothetical protein